MKMCLGVGISLLFLFGNVIYSTSSEPQPLAEAQQLPVQPIPVSQAVSVVTPHGNQFLNPGFEDGKSPWFSMPTWKTDFSLSTQTVHSGRQSAFLHLDSQEPDQLRGSQLYGAVQEINPPTFPEEISGYYYVEHWQQGTPKQYIQFVVIVLGAKNSPPSVAGIGNYQIRYVLAGVAQPPFELSNAHYIFLNTQQPTVGQWVHFRRSLAEDFRQIWGEIPQRYDKLRILFEVRWDSRKKSDGASSAQVFFDDLFVGEKLN